MIRHLFKLIWNRKRVNALILLEIVLAFLVLCAVMVTVAVQVSNYRLPLGFSIEGVWSIEVDTHLPWQTGLKQTAEGMRLVYAALDAMPEIEATGGMRMGPYSHSTSISNREVDGRSVEAWTNAATSGTGEVLRVRMSRGRWFTADDEASARGACVINERMAKDVYGDADPVGKILPFDSSRIVGVVQDFRKGGEFMQPVNYFISHIRLNDTADAGGYSTILIRVKPGTTAEFQERLIRTLESVEKDWTFTASRLEQVRKTEFRQHLAPIVAFAVVAGFLLFMVALGLIGVLWQNVSRRTQEIGLRRALGGTARSVYGQILGELLVLTTFGLAIGALIAVQFPLLELISEVPAQAYAVGVSVAVVLMYLLTLACGFYPSWLTMEIRPAEALHYE